MEKYLEILLSQIRCKKARPFIGDEIKDHLECQIEENLASGMTYEEAEKSAVADMGDPVEAGVMLDRIHRPEVAWPMLILVGVISLIGIAVHYWMSQTVYDTNLSGVDYLSKNIVSNQDYYLGVLIGFIAMAVVYFVDYSVIAKHSKTICTAFLVAELLYSLFGYHINNVGYFAIGKTYILAAPFFMLYVPVFGGVLYKYRNTGKAGIIKSLAWLFAPILIAVISAPELYLAFVLYVSEFSLLIIAVSDGWFDVIKKRARRFLCSLFFLLPIVGLGGLYLRDFAMNTHLMLRYHSYLHPHYNDGVDVVSLNLRNQLENSAWIGGSGQAILESGEKYSEDFLFTYIIGTYGILAGALACVMLAVLIVAVFMAVTKQKNRVGMLMGCGCGILLLVNGGLNILENLGVLPLSQTFFPFLSSGQGYIIFSYILIGMVMSIYRYKNVFPRHIVSTNDTRGRGWRIIR